MNERIRLLAEQCHHRYSEHNIDLEKFADLIMFECIKLAVFKGDKATAQAIKEHFEVK